jgi:hypothetical protein
MEGERKGGSFDFQTDMGKGEEMTVGGYFG